MQHWYQPHPYGVLPKGNAMGDESLQLCRRMGSLYTARDRSEADELECTLELVSFLDPISACRLSSTCSAWYAFLHVSDFWKRLYQSLSPERLRFRKDWKTSCIHAWEAHRIQQTKVLLQNGDMTTGRRSVSARAVNFTHRPMRCDRPIFNDILFQSWMCTIMPMDYRLIKVAPMPRKEGDKASSSYGGGECSSDDDMGAGSVCRPRHAERGAADAPAARWQYKSKLKPIPRADGSRMSPDDFQATYERAGVPVILTGIATQWPIYSILQGSFRRMAQPELFRGGTQDTPMRCEHTTMTAAEYLEYATTQNDERPIYLFDAEFGDALRADSLFTVPPMCAVDDYFNVMGKDRPKYRWLIAGPARGGSSFHVDPNMTHAWNACLTGRKRWILFPPNEPPPGVHPSEDMSEVTTPVSLTEWLMNFYDESVAKLKNCGYEGVCEEGEVMYVPAGWWHFVVNLEDSVALTQNYVSRTNLPKVIQFLRTMKSSISGVDEDADGANMQMVARRREGFAEEFVAAMRVSHREITKDAEQLLEDAATARRNKRPREVKVEMLEAESDGFSFSF
ncbi:Hypothetical protein, putative [Bodo saltans]|uniref:JmjC domain-containing protein n=1 Tax=Bodo saltans TaxID=75058 RepID=A0A0S4JT19_BODSA|nr:Hypothetical protein, putative [Bodo saltans]|eukprot:CUG93348.1 Hypothetical protein, putative [Bodo saltans]